MVETRVWSVSSRSRGCPPPPQGYCDEVEGAVVGDTRVVGSADFGAYCASAGGYMRMRAAIPGHGGGR